MKKKLALILVVVMLILSLSAVGLVGCSLKSDKKVITEKDFDGNVDNLKVGIISDTQLPRDLKKGEVNQYKEQLKAALNLLKEQKIEMLMFAGDIVDLVSDFAYKTFTDTIAEVWTDKDSTPIMQFIMGNHDYWYKSDYQSTTGKQNKFKEKMNQSPWTHYVVSGTHFIGASPDRGNNLAAYDKHLDWLAKEIKIAEDDTKDTKAPIFVMTHHNPYKTAYGSDEWGDKALGKVLKGHEQVVSISGHSHYSVLDERSLWQDDYTAFTTQSLAYIELEGGKFDPAKGEISSVPPQAELKQIALIMNIGKTKTTIERWNVQDKVEEKVNQRWVLNYPMERGNFAYTDKTRAIGRVAPQFKENTDVVYSDQVPTYTDNGVFKKNIKGLVFDRATHADIVNSYVIVYTNKLNNFKYTYEHFSEYYLGEKYLSENLQFKIGIPPNLPSGTYFATIYAKESFGLMSSPINSGEFVW